MKFKCTLSDTTVEQQGLNNLNKEFLIANGCIITKYEKYYNLDIITYHIDTTNFFLNFNSIEEIVYFVKNYPYGLIFWRENSENIQEIEIYNSRRE